MERATSLAQEGQYSRALEALTSLGMAEDSPETIAEMQRKHPAPLHNTVIPNSQSPPRAFSPSEVRKAAESFSRGSAAGPSGMRPEHLLVALKVTPGNRGEKACTALTKLVYTTTSGEDVALLWCTPQVHHEIN